MAMQAPAEKLAFVAMVNGNNNGRHGALGVMDVDPESPPQRPLSVKVS
jgi:56kDa selenium binding protein (SBP56)